MKATTLRNLSLALAFGAATTGLSACTDAGGATQTLEKSGFENVQITGYNFLACSEDDFYHTGFKAENAKGQSVTGTVCKGLFFKGSTIRFD